MKVNRRAFLAGGATSVAAVLVGCDASTSSSRTSSAISPTFVTRTPTPRPSASPTNSSSAAPTPVESAGSSGLLFRDEFAAPAGSPWSSAWSPVLAEPGKRDGGVQTYTDDSSVLFTDGDGHGVIRASRDAAGQWRSAMVYGPTLLYGSVYVRARLPTGQGIFPAVWLLAADAPAPHAWPEHGEIDIVETFNTGRKAVQSLHFPADTRYSDGTLRDAAVSSIHEIEPGWHEYRVDRSPDAIRISIDSTPVHTFRESDLPKGKWAALQYPQKVVLNQCIGGFHGPPDDSTPSPSDMLIDYVRITR